MKNRSIGCLVIAITIGTILVLGFIPKKEEVVKPSDKLKVLHSDGKRVY